MKPEVPPVLWVVLSVHREVPPVLWVVLSVHRDGEVVVLEAWTRRKYALDVAKRSNSFAREHGAPHRDYRYIVRRYEVSK